jgi:Nucleosome assembly protein (NAP)
VSYLKGKNGVPDFWLKALKQNKMIWDTIKEKDEEIMNNLKHVETITSENPENDNIILTL